MRRTIVVNLIAPPNSNKKITAEMLCDELLRKDVTCTIVSQDTSDMETARYSSVKDEIFIFSKQFHKMFRLHGGVEVIITDRPLVLSLYYNSKFGQGYYQTLNNLILEQHENFYNMNFYLDNGFPGKEHSIGKDALEEMDGELREALKQYKINYTVVTNSTERISEMSKLIIAEVEDYRKTDEYQRIQEQELNKVREEEKNELGEDKQTDA